MHFDQYMFAQSTCNVMFCIWQFELLSKDDQQEYEENLTVIAEHRKSIKDLEDTLSQQTSREKERRTRRIDRYRKIIQTRDEENKRLLGKIVEAVPAKIVHSFKFFMHAKIENFIKLKSCKIKATMLVWMPFEFLCVATKLAEEQ